MPTIINFGGWFGSDSGSDTPVIDLDNMKMQMYVSKDGTNTASNFILPDSSNTTAKDSGSLVYIPVLLTDLGLDISKADHGVFIIDFNVSTFYASTNEREYTIIKDTSVSIPFKKVNGYFSSRCDSYLTRAVIGIKDDGENDYGYTEKSVELCTIVTSGTSDATGNRAKPHIGFQYWKYNIPTKGINGFKTSGSNIPLLLDISKEITVGIFINSVVLLYEESAS